MKTVKKLILAAVAITCLIPSANLFAQEEETATSPFDLGLDIYSSYIWRGAKFGSGAAFQPWVEASFGNLAVGAWGSVNSGGLKFDDQGPIDGEAMEMDLYIGYSIGDLGITVTDYYFGGSWTSDSTHYIEPSLSYSLGDFSVMGAYMFAPDFEEADMYFELGYSFENVSLAVGAGDGAYTDDGDFMLCNVTLGTSKEIAITEKFALPVSGSVTLNPATGGFYITAGISF